MLWDLGFLHSPIVHVLAAVGVIISSILSTIYLECHWDGGPSVEGVALDTKAS